MNTLRLCFLELCRLLACWLTWLVIALTLLSPLSGLWLFRPASAGTMLSMYLANPAIVGGAAGGILFGLFTVYELDRSVRSRVNLLTDAVIPAPRMALIHLWALSAAALLALCLTMAVWLPVSRALIGSVFDIEDFALAYLLFMGPALLLAILAAAAFWQFSGRADLSLVLFAAFAGLSLTVWADRWQLCWLNPCVWALSDDFSNGRMFRSVAYMRFNWLLFLSGVWLLSWLCIRQYGKGLSGSLARSIRIRRYPAAVLLLLLLSGTAYAAQPMVDRSNPDQTVMAFSGLPWLDGVTCTSRQVQVFPDTSSGSVSGTASFQFENVSGQARTAAFGINPGYRVTSVRANGAEVSYSVSSYEEFNEALLSVLLPSDETILLTVEYGGFPRENRNTSVMQGRLEISSEYICLEHGALSPRLINVLPGGTAYPASVEITLPASMTVIPFGDSDAQVIASHADGTATWRYETDGTGGVLYAGDYIREDITAGGIGIELYYGRRHQAVMESAGAANAVKAVADYCTAHYGPLSFGSGGTLKLIQSRVTGGGYATEGASLLDETDFTAANLEDGSKGAGAGEVMIHELVHQWWGLGNMFDTSNPADAWSAEGLTVYTTYRIVKELYGEDYAREHYTDRWQSEVDDYRLNFYVRRPEYLSALPGKQRLEISNRLSYVRQYCEMPLKILKAEKLVGGEAAMDQILSDLFNRELDPQSPFLTFQEFLDACGLNEEDLNLE